MKDKELLNAVIMPKERAFSRKPHILEKIAWLSMTSLPQKQLPKITLEHHEQRK